MRIIYLGRIVSLTQQIAALSNVLQELLKQRMHSLPLVLNRKLIDLSILPILTHGAQNWSLTKAQNSQFRMCQRAMERSIGTWIKT